MAKRFFDTNKFEDTWYFDLPTKYKLLYDYILAKCDAVGVWKPNMKMASFTLGEQLDANEFIELCGTDRLYVKPNGDWFLKKFCDFQYGVLSERSTSKPIQSYILLLKKHTLWIEYSKGIDTLKEKDKEKDKDKDKEKDTKINTYDEFYLSRKEAFKNYPAEFISRLENDFGVVSCLCYTTDKVNEPYKDFVDIIYQATTDKEWINQLSRGRDLLKVRTKLAEFVNYCLTSQSFRVDKYMTHYDFQKHFVNKYLNK